MHRLGFAQGCQQCCDALMDVSALGEDEATRVFERADAARSADILPRIGFDCRSDDFDERFKISWRPGDKILHWIDADFDTISSAATIDRGNAQDFIPNHIAEIQIAQHQAQSTA